jgi:hypothetical protein
MGFRRRRVVACVVTAVVLASSQALSVVLDNDNDEDGRSHLQPRSRQFSMRRSLFAVADNNVIFNDRWFREKSRCSKDSFDSIDKLIETYWESVHEPIKKNAAFFVRNRTAVAMFYLTHSGCLSDSESLFGVSKTTALRSVKQPVDVLTTSVLPFIIRQPQSIAEWDRLAKGFENMYGFPSCVWLWTVVCSRSSVHMTMRVGNGEKDIIRLSTCR